MVVLISRTPATRSAHAIALFSVTCGTVKLNGRNVKELTNQEIHDKVGIVQQRSVLFIAGLGSVFNSGNCKRHFPKNTQLG